VTTLVSRAARGLLRAYRVACAREDMRRHGLRTPLGVWFCARCRLVMFDRIVWRGHLACCAA